MQGRRSHGQVVQSEEPQRTLTIVGSGSPATRGGMRLPPTPVGCVLNFFGCNRTISLTRRERTGYQNGYLELPWYLTTVE